MSSAIVSVIVPTYNYGKYIEECIDSLIEQDTDYEYEVLIIDDGSTDDTSKIVKKYLHIPYISYYYKDNAGVSEARNYGIEKAKGKYIAFADADDYVKSCYVDRLVKTAENDHCDMVTAGYTISFEKTKGKIDVIYKNSAVIIDDKKIYMKMFSSNGLLNVSYSKLYKKEIIIRNDIRFRKELKTGEDLVFNLNYLRNLQSIVFLDESIYIYNRRDVVSGVNSYKPDLLYMTTICLDTLRQYYTINNLLDDELKQILGNYYLDYINAGIYNLFRKECKLSFGEKKKMVNDYIELDRDHFYLSNNRKDQLSKLGYFLIKTRKTSVIIGTYSILFWARNHFSGFYIMLRKKLMERR